MTPPEPPTQRRLLARVARAQATARLPSLSAGVVVDGQLAWHAGRGRVDGAPPTSDTQYRIGSISKTFTAILVMRRRDAGLLALGDPLDRHLPGSPFGDRTIGELLAHTAGVQAEPAGAWWERTAGSDWAGTVAPLDERAVPFDAGARFHYSNLGFAALGEVAARGGGRSWFECLDAEVLQPLGMRRTTYRPQAPHAQGFGVHPWADVVLPEPEHDHGALAAAGQLWSTLDDLGRLAALLLGDTGEVLSPDTVAEMAEPRMVEELGEEVSASYGLGLQVFQQGGLRLVGHAGAMPGFVASVLVDRDDGRGGVWQSNTTYGGDWALAPDLLAVLRECEPPIPDEWEPAAPPPGVPLDVLGPWFFGPNAFALRAAAGGFLELGPLGRRGRTSRFQPVGGEWRGLTGYWAGEVLRFAPDGRSFEVATFLFTRTPYDPAAPVPGGVTDDWQPPSPS